MNAPMISALGTDVAVSLAGTGSFVPETAGVESADPRSGSARPS